MSFFQILTNAYVPYRTKLVEGDLFTSILHIAYNGCHRLVAHTVEKSTIFRQKTCLETMLFLIAIELKHIQYIKNKENEDVKSLSIGVSTVLSRAIKEELRTSIEKIHYSAHSFIEERINTHFDLISNLDENSSMILMSLMLEQPLAIISKKVNHYGEFEYSLDYSKSTLINRLDKHLQIQSLITLEVAEAREGINKMYGMA